MRDNKSNRIEIIAGVITIILLAVSLSFYRWQKTGNTANDVLPQANQRPAGIIKKFDNNIESNQKTINTPQQITEKDKQTTSFSTTPYIFDLPSGWKKIDTEIQKNPCGDNIDTLKDTYANGSKTIIVYENGNPAGCSGENIADVYLDFDYTDSSSSILINTDEITQCTKEQNPKCPKGDGKVSIMLGNKTKEDPSKYEINKITGKTYYFSIVDTVPTGNFSTQVKSLAELVQKIKFN